MCPFKPIMLIASHASYKKKLKAENIGHYRHGNSLVSIPAW
jgi:hypothetical protein